MSTLAQTQVVIEIPFYDVDSYRVVWHGNYPKYFEVARCQLLEHLTIPYAVLEKIGYFYPVIEMDVKFIKPLHFTQRIMVTAELKEYRSKLRVDYLIVDAQSQERITKGSTSQVAVLPEGVMQYEAPAEVVARIDRVLACR